MTRSLTLTLALLSAATILPAQNSASRRASMTGSRGDHGKCTIEVNVDGVAEIELSGTQGDMHTLTGTPSNWVRFECSDALPRNPEDFKFSGVDGRGRQVLLRDPRNNRGVAVVRIEDPKGGREGYTFDIEWRGFSNQGGGRYDPGAERYPGNNNGGNTGRSIDACLDAVRTKADKDYGYRNLDFGRVAFDDNPGRRDQVVGRFTYRRGRTQDEFQFTCTVDQNNARVRSVEIRRF